MAWNRRIAVIGLVLAALAAIAAWLVQPEFRRWVGLDKKQNQNNVGKMSISGIVVNRDTNQGVGQALITIVGRTEQYVTEDSGNFRIDLPSTVLGRLRVHVSKSGFQPLDTSVEPPIDNLVLALRKQ
jgi:hypothetical protein